MVAIGYLALAFSIICGIIYLIGSTMEKDKPVRDVDYRSLYSKVLPKEL